MSRPDQDAPEELDRVQRWMQAVITHPGGIVNGADSDEAMRLISAGGGNLEQVISRSQALSAAERLAVYGNAYYSRLIECLGDVFPVLKRTLGDDAFDGFAFGYLQQFPSRSYTLNHLGREFARYLADTRPQPGESDAALEDGDEQWPEFLIDLARIEWVIYEVFDGPGWEQTPILPANDLLGIAPEQWAEARLKPVPCLQVMATTFPVNAYYTAARQAKPGEDVSIPAAATGYVAITRRGYIVRRHELTRTQFDLLSALMAGGTIGEAIAAAAGEGLESVDTLAARLHEWFGNWAAEGFFEALER